MITQINNIIVNGFGLENIVHVACFVYVMEHMIKFGGYLYKKARRFWIND